MEQIPNNNQDEKIVDNDLQPKDINYYSQVCVIQGMTLGDLDAEGFKQYLSLIHISEPTRLSRI